MSNYMGTVGRKLTVPCKKFTFVKSIFSQHGVLYMYRFEDYAGNVYMWRAKNRLEANEVTSVTEIKGLVQAHETYDGVKETIMVCCTINPKRRRGTPKLTTSTSATSRVVHSPVEVAKLLEVSYQTVNTWCREGIIRADDVRDASSSRAMYSISNAEMLRIIRLKDRLSTTENVQWQKVLLDDLKPSVAFIKSDKKPVPVDSVEEATPKTPIPEKATVNDDVSKIIEKIARYKRLCAEISRAEEMLVNMRAARDSMKSQIIDLL